jgi:sarcosine oxidase, subunit alpha
VAGGGWARVYEPAIRRARGLGKAPKNPIRTATCNATPIATCWWSAPDRRVCRGARRPTAGARVILCDEQAEFGGSLLHDRRRRGQAAATWVADAVAELAAARNVTLLPRTTAFGYFAQNFVGAGRAVTDHLAEPDARQPRERLWQVRAKEVVLATGAIERPLVFPATTGRASCWPRRRAPISTATASRPERGRWSSTDNDDAYRRRSTSTRRRRDRGDRDLRKSRTAGRRCGQAAGHRGQAGDDDPRTHGRLRVKSADLAPVAGGRGERVACDLLLMSGGWTPSVHLFSQSRGKVVFDEALGAFVPGAVGAARTLGGRVQGDVRPGACVAEGRAAGEAAAKAARAGAIESAAPSPFRPRSRRLPRQEAKGSARRSSTSRTTSRQGPPLAVREGFRSIEHVKRYTTTGMATDQGKTSNMNALSPSPPTRSASRCRRSG